MRRTCMTLWWLLAAAGGGPAAAQPASNPAEGPASAPQRAYGRVELIHFPYDPDSHSRRIPGVAEPSNPQIRDLNLPIRGLPGTIGDYEGSEHFEKILAILGRERRRDALHVDSAVKSRCAAFITADSDILKHKRRLFGLLGIRFFDARAHLGDLELLITRERQAKGGG